MKIFGLENGIGFYTLPVFHLPYFKYRKTIFDREYILKFRYNSEADFWSMGFYDLDETVILPSVKIRTGDNLILNYLYKLDLPQTAVLCFNSFDKDNYPSQFDIEEKYQIGYYNITYED